MSNWIERFWAKVIIRGPDECWEWTAQRHKDGYGLFKREGVKRGAHQIAYELTYGPIPPGMVVRHTCDHPWCCNPGHLESGTQADNVHDMIERGRRPTVYRAHLTPEQVYSIRCMYWYDLMTEREVVAKTGLPGTVIGRVIRGASYKDVHPLCDTLATRWVQGADGYLRMFCEEHAQRYADTHGGVVMLDGMVIDERAIPETSCYFIGE